MANSIRSNGLGASVTFISTFSQYKQIQMENGLNLMNSMILLSCHWSTFNMNIVFGIENRLRVRLRVRIRDC